MSNEYIKSVLNHLWLYESTEADSIHRQALKHEIKALKPKLRFVTKKVGDKIEITRIK